MGLRRLLVKMLDPDGHADNEVVKLSGGKAVWGGVPTDIEAVVDAVAAALVSGTNITSIVYNDALGTITINASGSSGVAASSVTFSPTGGLSSTDVQAALAELDTEKATLASPTFTGDPKAPTPTAGDNDTSIATTAFVQAAITALIGGAPGALDTLKELADAINDDASYAATVTAALALKAPLASPGFTGNPTAPTVAGTSDSTTKIATTAFVQAVAALLAPLASPTFTGDPKAPTPAAGDNDTSIATSAFVTNAVAKQPEVLLVAVSDESTTALTTGTAKITFRMPFAFTVTQVRASLNTASSSGLPTVDVKDGGASIFSTLLSIDATEKTSQTAATAAVISGGSHAFADDSEVTIDITVAGTGAKGLKLAFIGTRT